MKLNNIEAIYKTVKESVDRFIDVDDYYELHINSVERSGTSSSQLLVEWSVYRDQSKLVSGYNEYDFANTPSPWERKVRIDYHTDNWLGGLLVYYEQVTHSDKWGKYGW